MLRFQCVVAISFSWEKLKRGKQIDTTISSESYSSSKEAKDFQVQQKTDWNHWISVSKTVGWNLNETMSIVWRHISLLNHFGIRFCVTYGHISKSEQVHQRELNRYKTVPCRHTANRHRKIEYILNVMQRLNILWFVFISSFDWSQAQ